MVKVGVVGASGYTGLELVKMLVNHPVFELNYLATTTGDTMIEILHASLEGVVSMPVDAASPEGVAENCALVFLALPHKAAMGFAKEVLKKGVKVVDLSADYRLELDTYEANYCDHEDKEHLDNSVYALIEYYREALKQTNLAAGPGCYPTFIIYDWFFF